MKKISSVTFLNTLLLSSLFFCAASLAQTRYVTDDFEVMLRTGPSIQNKIIKTLRSGTKLEVLDQDAGNGYSQIRIDAGDIGYVLTRFVTETPSARDRVGVLENQLTQLRSKPGELQALLADSQDQNNRLMTENANLSDQLVTTNAELTEIKRISGKSIDLSQQNQKLEGEVQQLLLQLDDIRIQNEILKDQSAKRWFILGGSAVFLGLLMGWILSISRRTRRQSWGS